MVFEANKLRKTRAQAQIKSRAVQRLVLWDRNVLFRGASGPHLQNTQLERIGCDCAADFRGTYIQHFWSH